MFKLAILSAAAAATAAAAGAGGAPQPPLSSADLDAQWSAFKANFNKSYADERAELNAMKNFVDNLRIIEARNQRGRGVHGVTKFSDMSQAEFERTMLTYRPSGKPKSGRVLTQGARGDAPAEYDWRDHGAITDVKDQGQCGSCWAFSAVEQIESAYFLAGNPLTEFSAQQLTSCDTASNAGCDGGDTIPAYEYVNSVGGLETEADYPYVSGVTEKDGDCKFEASKVAGGNIEADAVYMTDPCMGFKCDSQDEGTLMQNVGTVAPASICIDASTFNSYTGGLMTADDCKSSYFALDHCIQITGYKTGDAQYGDYWIVRNQWGKSWGEDGYVYIEMGTNACGIADEATTVTII